MQSFVAFLVGGLGAFGFAPYSSVPLLVLSLWYYCVSKGGFFWGVGFFLTGVYWVYVPIIQFTSATWYLAIVMVFLLVVVLALFSYLPKVILARCIPDSIHYLALPVLFSIGEYCRTFIGGGFPYLMIGDALSGTVLDGLHPILGSLGSGFLLLATVSFVSRLAKKKQWSGILLTTTIVIFIQTSLGFISWTKQVSSDHAIALISTQVKQSIKFTSSQALQTLKNIELLSTSTLSNNSVQIIIFPETAIPFSSDSVIPMLQSIKKQMRDDQMVITGIFLPHTQGYSNGILAFTSTNQYEYRKRQLVLFGEFWPNIPGANIISNLLNIPFSSLKSGAKQQMPLIYKDFYLIPTICFEVGYSRLFRHNPAQKSAFISISNNGWFGNTRASDQQLQIAISRVREYGKPLYLVSNYGTTTLITTDGKTQNPITSTDGVMKYPLLATLGSTPYNIWGNIPVVIIWLLILSIVIRYVIKEKRKLPV